MVKCVDCETVWDNADIDVVQEYRGEFWGTPAYEAVAICPRCKSDDLDWDYDPRDKCRGCAHYKWGAFKCDLECDLDLEDDEFETCQSFVPEGEEVIS